MTEQRYDLIIAGTGPAGMTAAFYAQRLGLQTVVLGDIPGGNMYMIESLANFPGFPGGIPGTELGVKMYQQAQMEGVFFPMLRLKSLASAADRFVGTDADGGTYAATAAVMATGRVPVRLPGKQPEMAGINFCSVCDGPLYRDQSATLAVVGSDNAAAQHALTLARIAEKVYLIYRSRQVCMDAAHERLLRQQDNIVFMPETEAVGYVGDAMLAGLRILDAGGSEKRVDVSGVFMAIGWRPNSDLLDFDVETDADGYLVTDDRCMTSVAGLFAAGDIRKTDLNQVLTACADGARAAKHASDYLKTKGAVQG